MEMWDGTDLEMVLRSLAQHRRLGIARHTAWEYTFAFGSIATYLFSLWIRHTVEWSCYDINGWFGLGVDLCLSLKISHYRFIGYEWTRFAIVVVQGRGRCSIWCFRIHGRYKKENPALRSQVCDIEIVLSI